MTEKRSLGLGLGGATKFFNFPAVEPTVDKVTPAEPEFLEPVEEDDRAVEFGVPDTVVATSPLAPILSDDPYDHIPSTGSWMSPDGVEYSNGVPAFLMRPDRPRSNIR